MRGDYAKRVLIVADDLTGALDSAGAFAARGLPTKVITRACPGDDERVRSARVVAVDTASRHLPPEGAGSLVQAAAGYFAGQQFSYLFKKIDSTLRGNVVAETCALMDASARRVALVAPAFPAQGRTVRDGVVHVDGTPLALTGFASDALSPPPLEPLGDLFASALGRDQVKAWRGGQPLTLPETGAVIADAGREEDLAELIDLVSGQAAQLLLVGSAGLGEVLARHLQDVAIPATVRPATDRPVLFVVGSRSARSREQVDRLRREPGTTVIDAPDGLIRDSASSRGAHQVVVLATDEAGTERPSSAEVARRLARTGLEIAASVNAGALVVTGGDTAAAVLKAADCRVLDVCGNLMPGIPFSQIRLKGRTADLVTKAGGFGTADTFIEILRCLRNASSGR